MKWPKPSVMPRQFTPSAHGLQTRASERNCGSSAASRVAISRSQPGREFMMAAS